MYTMKSQHGYINISFIKEKVKKKRNLKSHYFQVYKISF